jgi:hypothetical protein
MADYMHNDLAAREYGHGRALRESKRAHELKLAEMIETLRGQNSARVAQIGADVGMAEIESKKPFYTAQATDISTLTPYKEAGAQQDIELGGIRNRLASMQLEREPELYRRKLEGLDLDTLLKQGTISAGLNEYAEDENFPRIAEGILPERILASFRNKKKAEPVASLEIGGPVGRQQNPWLRTASYALPIAGTALGALAGSTVWPGVGTYVGGAAGGALLEYGRQKLLGEETSPVAIGMAGVAGAAGSKIANRTTRSILSRRGRRGRRAANITTPSQRPIPQPSSSLEERRLALPPVQYSRWR